MWGGSFVTFSVAKLQAVASDGGMIKLERIMKEQAIAQ
jgi:hypothetical protein